VAVQGTNGFVGEFLVLLGTFKSNLGLGYGVLAATAVILGAAYMLWMVQKVFFGGITHRENQHLRDMNVREMLTTAPFIVLVAVMGLMPQPFLDRIAPSTDRYVARASVGAPNVTQAKDAQLRVEVMSLPSTAAAARPTVPAAPLAARE
jgi:NADH-quinone oxidoreductase subunit M